MTPRLTLGVLALLSHLAVAQPAAPWPQEPAAVLGVELGVPVFSLKIPKCVEHTNDFYDQATCWRGTGTGEAVTLKGLPDLGVSYSAMVMLHEGVVSSVVLSGEASQFHRLKDILIQRYGPPTAAHLVEISTRAGANLTSQRLSWKGARTVIEADERSGRIDESRVVFYDNATVARRVEATRKANAAAASKL